jgi:AraC-like DNA-binding protein
LLDMTRPFEFGMGDDCVHGSIGISFDALALPVDTIRRSAALLQSSPVHDLFSGHLRGLIPATRALTDTRQITLLAAATVELARALIATSDGDDPRRNAPFHDALRTRIKAYVQQHLSEPSLTADRIAAAHNISVRHLYKLWSFDNDLPPAEWIIAGRIEGARRELARPDGDPATIAAVARRWGFVDAPHFSRRFRLAYGMSPREWRQLNRELPTVPALPQRRASPRPGD